jgi:Holliday junction resolvasome RuvABC DNA-binding subunit
MSKQPQQTNDLLVEISSKLDKVLKLLAIDAVKGFEKEQQKIELLDSLGFKPSEIAKLLNKSPENVSVVLGSIRKKKDPKQKTMLKSDETTNV